LPAVLSGRCKADFPTGMGARRGSCIGIARIFRPLSSISLKGNYAFGVATHEMDIAAVVRPNIDRVLVKPAKKFNEMHRPRRTCQSTAPPAIE
jgi:hypothetical protein